MEEKYVLKIQENEDRSKSNTKRLDEHDKKLDELSDMYVALTKVDNKVTNVEKDVTEIKTDLKSIKEKPSKRWEQVVNLVISRYRNSYTGFSCCKIRVMKGEIVMKELKKLIDVKSIVTLVLTILFCVLSLKQIIDGQSVMTIYTTVIAFYFGTQYQKKAGVVNDGDTKETNTSEQNDSE